MTVSHPETDDGRTGADDGPTGINDGHTGNQPPVRADAPQPARLRQFAVQRIPPTHDCVRQIGDGSPGSGSSEGVSLQSAPGDPTPYAGSAALG